MKNRSLRTGLLTAVVSALVLLAGLTTVVGSLLSARDLRAILDERVRSAAAAIESDAASRRAALTAALSWFERSTRVIQALGLQDPSNTAELAQLVTTSFGADSFLIADPRGVVVGGASIAHRPSVLAALTGKARVGFEVDSGSELAIRGATPVYNTKNVLVGVVAMGHSLSQSAYVDRLKGLLDAEVTVFVGDTRLATSLTDETGKRLVGTKLANPAIEDKVLARGEPYYGTNRIRGQSYSTVYIPLRDDQNVVVGMTFVGLSLALVEECTRNLVVTFSALSLGVLVVTLVFLVLYLQRRLIHPLVLTSHDLERMAEGRVPLVDEARLGRGDEIGLMARSLAGLASYLDDGGNVATAIAQGNLVVEPRIAGPEDRFGLAFSAMTTQLNTMILHIRRSAHEVAGGIRQISEGTTVLSVGASENAASIEQMEASLAEILGASEDNAREAREAATLSTAVNQSSQASTLEMDTLLKAMDAIEASARDIEGVVKTIDDIAFQVNLLALNANIEAARAGKYGKGFGVVAEEVRALARRSTEAVHETTRMVNEVKGRISSGTLAARATGGHLTAMSSGVAQMTTVLGQVAVRSQGQSDSLGQLNLGMTQLSQVTQTNAATAEESASVTLQLQGVASDLEATTLRFQLRE